MLSKTLRDRLIKQANAEIAFDRAHKQKKIARWQLNENLLYQVKSISAESRANVDLGQMGGFVETYISKIDSPLTFKYRKRKESQLSRVERLNSLKETDANVDFWDLKDLAGKDQYCIYGRAVFAFHADSINGYKAYLENVDVYDFLIDPSGGGIDMEKARNMGRYGVSKDAYELQNNDSYIKSEVRKLITSGNTAENDKPQEEINKQNRRESTDVKKEIEIPDANKYVFWEWYTTLEGKRYYLLMQENGAAIRVEEWAAIQKPTKHFPMGAWPFWSYASRPNVTEFWTPGPADRVREIFMAQNVSINQSLDNGEEHNKPMKLVNVGAIENLGELKYRRGGYIKSKNGVDLDKALQVLRPSAIDTPLKLFSILEAIADKSSGVTADAKGASETDKVGIYEGNQANAADRYGLTNKSYAFGYKRFAQLYEMGVRQHLTKKVAIDIIGPEGIETEEVSKRDIFHKDEDFGILVEASNAEQQASAADQKNRLGFLAQNAGNPVQNPKKAYEMGAKIAGFEDDQIKELLDTSEFGDAKIMAEAARDIELLLEGKQLKPNRRANVAYKQKFVDYLKDHEEDMTNEEFRTLTNYILICEPIIMQNTARAMTQIDIKAGLSPDGAPPAPPQNGTAVLPNPPMQNESPVQV
jgi:hypothetical protein